MAEGKAFYFRRRLWAVVGLVALLAYVGWIGAPYLRSVVVRDAAMTTWIDVASAPITGFVDDNPLHAGDSVGQDGRIATIENPLEDATPMVRAEADVGRAKQRLRGLEELMSGLEADPALHARTAMELADAKIEAETAEKILTSVKSAYDKARLQPVKAPPDSYVWSLIASPDNFVKAGEPIASWVNAPSCSLTCRCQISSSRYCRPTLRRMW
jgi:multidrug resistance efflux pump